MAGSSFNMGRTLMPAVTTLTSKTMMPPMIGVNHIKCLLPGVKRTLFHAAQHVRF
jgi:hypothetical protein